MRTTDRSATDDSIAAHCSATFVPYVGSSRTDACVVIDPARHVAVSAIGERQAGGAQPKHTQKMARSAVTPDPTHSAPAMRLKPASARPFTRKILEME
jgi:hypothetical protein